MPQSFDINEFIVNGNFSQIEISLALIYHEELVYTKEWITVSELKKVFVKARITPPGNLSSVIKRAEEAEYLIVNRTQGILSFKLSLKGIEFVKKTIKYDDSISEETELLKGISQSLYTSLENITNLDERGYIQEALMCLSSNLKAYRAAILMGWAGAIYHLRKQVERIGFDSFCVTFEKLSLGKTKRVNSIDDLEYYQEKDFLLVIEKMGLIDKGIKKQLDNCLDLRNACGHPTQVKPQIHKVKSFFEDIIQYALVR